MNQANPKKALRQMKSKKNILTIAAVLALSFSQVEHASSKPMDEQEKQFCSSIGLIYHNQAKTYDDKIKKGQELFSQSKDDKMKKMMQGTFHDMQAVRDSLNKAGDFMDKEFGKADSPQQIKFASDNLTIPLKKLQESSDICIKLKAFN